MDPSRYPDAIRRLDKVTAEHPDRLAVTDDRSLLTFAQLAARVDDIAAGLLALGCGQGTRIGLCMQRSVDLVASLLAIWRIGAVYAPFDISYPHSRLAVMQEVAMVGTFLTDEVQDLPWAPGCDVYDLGTVIGPGRDGPVKPYVAEDADPAYIIFTSGSTGRPKAVEGNRGGVAFLISAMEHAGFLSPAHRTVAWNSTVSFDFSILQWTRVCRGDTLVISDYPTSPRRLRRFLDEHGVDEFEMTPSYWTVARGAVLGRGPESRKLRLFLGGEAIPPDVWDELVREAADHHFEAINLYGPTECTVASTGTRISGPTPNIGPALPGVQLHVLTDTLQPTGVGEPGELYIAGPGLSNGYVDRPDLTMSRYVADPFRPGERMYRTGDLVAFREDGSLAFLGRVDEQVKVRGYRIELGEIDSAVRSHPGVVDAATVVTTLYDTITQLATFYVPAPDTPPDRQALARHVGTVLPRHMVPSAFWPVDALPTRPNGKLDRSQLAALATKLQDQEL